MHVETPRLKRKKSRVEEAVEEALFECAPLLSGPELESGAERKEVGATILGIHNLSIVAPQFLVAIVASIIFRITSAVISATVSSSASMKATGDVVWVLRFGGLMTVGAVVASRYIVQPRSEIVYQNVLNMAALGEDDEDEEE